MSSRAPTRPLAILCVTVLLTVLAVLVPAALPRAQAEGFNTGRTGPSMLVFDASGSMGADDVGGRTRMEVAKEAVTTDPLPASSRQREGH